MSPDLSEKIMKPTMLLTLTAGILLGQEKKEADPTPSYLRVTFCGSRKSPHRLPLPVDSDYSLRTL